MAIPESATCQKCLVIHTLPNLPRCGTDRGKHAVSLFPCVTDDIGALCRRVYDRITRKAEHLVAVGEEIEREFGVPIVNKRISVRCV